MKIKLLHHSVKKKLLLLCLFILVLLYTACNDQVSLNLPDNEEYSTVTGYVTPTGVSGTVYLFETGVIDSAELDDETGYFSFDSIPYGSYYIRVKADDYAEYNKYLSINSRTTVMSTIMLDKISGLISRQWPTENTELNQTFMADNDYDIGDSTVSFKIYFNKKMDEPSIIKAFTSSPSQNNLGIKLTYETENNNNFLKISVPILNLFHNAEVSFSLGKDAKDVFGNNLDNAYTMVFPVDTSYLAQIQTDLIIRQVNPQHDAVSVSPSKTITVYFHKKMVEKNVENAFFIKPEKPANFFWNTGSSGATSVEIKFATPLVSATSYTYGFKAGICSKDSLCTSEDLSYSFQTTSIQLSNYKPYSGVPDFPLDSVFYYRFTATMDLEKFKESFHISPEVDSLDFEYYSYYTTTIHVYHSLLEENKAYTITIDSSCLGVTGDNPGIYLQQKFTTGGSVMGTQQQENEIRVSPSDSTDYINTGSYITIAFPDSMNINSVLEHYHLEPYVPAQLSWQYYSEDHQLRITPVQRLKANTLYTITLDRGYKNIQGDSFDTFTAYVKTYPLSLQEFLPQTGRINIDVDKNLSYEFSSAIDSLSFAENFVIEPEPDSLRFVFDSYEKEVTVRHSSFDRETTYKVTLGQGITDLYGAPLYKSYSLEFTTMK
ncbi:MAG: Ig-like domain-containing protein [Fibrobacteria bacterium]|nr:Ig-like domain-containing protein [Fibrobacteria bacterium]